MITQAKSEGVPITVETCPHYLVLSAEDVPEKATQFKCCPPVRGQENQVSILFNQISKIYVFHSEQLS